MNFYKSLAFLSLQKILVFYLVFSVPSKPIFVSDLFKLGQIIFSNVKDSFRNDNKFVKLCYLVYFNAGLVRNLRAHECPFPAFRTIVSRKFRHLPISQKVRGNTATD